eukprot:CAMPEP_0201995008 /NCGR_PEP_ID=MMETSP0905-20130828/2640_1 /ASSEMBLY_ACC=CAM_ASM_000554 /TAXON_ID=420261 /ORGANISM="Thalassiosira antarctica, Strain CCMP982" /LENGTH=150 /DNA_ID=CAMNT_0048550063 /DNA_START=73 /DNA_END=526 /DNA_ORIENTATION=+
MSSAKLTIAYCVLSFLLLTSSVMADGSIYHQIAIVDGGDDTGGEGNLTDRDHSIITANDNVNNNQITAVGGDEMVEKGSRGGSSGSRSRPSGGSSPSWSSPSFPAPSSPSTPSWPSPHYRPTPNNALMEELQWFAVKVMHIVLVSGGAVI